MLVQTVFGLCKKTEILMLRFVPGVVQFQSVCFVMAGVEMHINPGLGIDDH